MGDKEVAIGKKSFRCLNCPIQRYQCPTTTEMRILSYRTPNAQDKIANLKTKTRELEIKCKKLEEKYSKLRSTHDELASHCWLLLNNTILWDMQFRPKITFKLFFYYISVF